MLLSMTAFGKAKNAYEDCTVAIELQSVNKKFLDVYLKAPSEWQFFEHDLRQVVEERIDRGQITLVLHVLYTDSSAVSVQVNFALADGLQKAMQQLASRLGHDVSSSELFNMCMREKGVIVPVISAADNQGLQHKVKDTLIKAIESLLEMEKREGALIASEFQMRLETMRQMKQKIEVYAPAAPNRFRVRIEALLEEFTIDEERVSKEVALLSDKLDISEELFRFGYHIDHFDEVLESKKPSGKVLEFILQEMLREVNTISSKCQDAEISRCVITCKSEIDKMKEQAANVQ